MLHAAFQVTTMLFDVIGAWLKHDLGAADYRIVRLAFFSGLAVWAAFTMARTAVDFIHSIPQLVIVRIPQLIFRLLCKIGRDIDAGISLLEQQYRDWLAARRKPNSRLVRGRPWIQSIPRLTGNQRRCLNASPGWIQKRLRSIFGKRPMP